MIDANFILLTLYMIKNDVHVILGNDFKNTHIYILTPKTCLSSKNVFFKNKNDCKINPYKTIHEVCVRYIT